MNCLTCNKEFKAINKNHKYCSRKCRPSQKNRKAEKVNWLEVRGDGCLFCGGSMGGKARKFCSKRCNVMYWHNRRDKSKKARKAREINKDGIISDYNNTDIGIHKLAKIYNCSTRSVATTLINDPNTVYPKPRKLKVIPYSERVKIYKCRMCKGPIIEGEEHPICKYVQIVWAKEVKRESRKEYDRDYSKRYHKEHPKTPTQKIIHSIRKRVQEWCDSRGIGKGRWYREGIGSVDLEGINKHMGPKPDDTNEWHRDHIIPISAFDLTKEEEWNACWHPINHQWLTAQDNMAKWEKWVING